MSIYSQFLQILNTLYLLKRIYNLSLFAIFANDNQQPSLNMSVNLLKKERKDLILKEINVHTRVTFAELVDVLNVSEDTIRRDLNELAEEGDY
jgi:Fic family protein